MKTCLNCAKVELLISRRFDHVNPLTRIKLIYLALTIRGARHGIKMNGKLARIEEQERLNLKELIKVSDAELVHKSKKKKHDEVSEFAESNSGEVECFKKSKKSKKISE